MKALYIIGAIVLGLFVIIFTWPLILGAMAVAAGIIGFVFIILFKLVCIALVGGCLFYIVYMVCKINVNKKKSKED